MAQTPAPVYAYNTGGTNREAPQATDRGIYQVGVCVYVCA